LAQTCARQRELHIPRIAEHNTAAPPTEDLNGKVDLENAHPILAVKEDGVLLADGQQERIFVGIETIKGSG
jgi:hypothetical protein